MAAKNKCNREIDENGVCSHLTGMPCDRKCCKGCPEIMNCNGKCSEAAKKFRIEEKGNMGNNEIVLINRIISNCKDLRMVEAKMIEVYPNAELIYRGGTHVSIHFTANTPRVMIVETEFAG